MQATQQELNDSIQALEDYRDRLRSEIILMSQKLRMSESKIKLLLEENSELKNLEKIIKELRGKIKQLK